GTAALNAVQAGLVMSIGPGTSAIVGVPAGRLTDCWGPRRASLAGLDLALGGCLTAVALPPVLGDLGYAIAPKLINPACALFQAANNTSVMQPAPRDRRGVLSALLGLSRNLGLIPGASAMGRSSRTRLMDCLQSLFPQAASRD